MYDSGILVLKIHCYIMSILGQIKACVYNGCGNFFNYALFLVILLVLSYIYYIGVIMQKIYSWILCSVELL